MASIKDKKVRFDSTAALAQAMAATGDDLAKIFFTPEGKVVVNKTDYTGIKDVVLTSGGESMADANGVVNLDGKVATLVNGKVPEAQLPSYVDDVVECIAFADEPPATCQVGDIYYDTSGKKLHKAVREDEWGPGSNPEKSKIYVNLTDDKAYRWGGSEMVEISSSTIYTDDMARLAVLAGGSAAQAQSRATALQQILTFNSAKVSTDASGWTQDTTDPQNPVDDPKDDKFVSEKLAYNSINAVATTVGAVAAQLLWE